MASCLHRWVRYTVERVDVIVDPETHEPTVVARPGGIVGEQVGCTECDEPLTIGSSVTVCGGDSTLSPSP